MAARPKAWVWGRSLAGIAGSNPVGDMDVSLLCFLGVLSGRGLYDGSIPHPEYGVSERDLEIPTMKISAPTRSVEA